MGALQIIPYPWPGQHTSPLSRAYTMAALAVVAKCMHSPHSVSPATMLRHMPAIPGQREQLGPTLIVQWEECLLTVRNQTNTPQPMSLLIHLRWIL